MPVEVLSSIKKILKSRSSRNLRLEIDEDIYYLGNNTDSIGIISSTRDIVIAGRFSGTAKTKANFNILDRSEVEGEIMADNLESMGKLEAMAIAKNTVIRASSRGSLSLKTTSLVVEDGSKINIVSQVGME